MSQNILIVDDDSGVLSALEMLLKAEGFSVVSAETPTSALAAINRQDFDLILMDLNYSRDTTSGDEGIKMIEAIRKLDELIPIVVMTGWGTIEVAVSTMQMGANDFVQKPWENDRLLAIISNQIKLVNSQKRSQKLTQQNLLLREQVEKSGEVIAESKRMRDVMTLVNQVAKSDVSVLLTGENGTGKSLFARYIHSQSMRKSESLVSVNMGAVTESLFESEMFGHLKGAFTDAKSTRIGRFELADRGTLFLDEIANTPYSQQGKLLRVLEESQFEKVGSSKTQTVNIRLVTATNATLDEMVNNGEFRKDLLYRINTIEIEIPPLRERIEDILPLANDFLRQVADKYAQPVLIISNEAAKVLQSYSWPGNVRELGHVMERAQILCQGDSIGVSELGIAVQQTHTEKHNSFESGTLESNSSELRTLASIELEVVQQRLAYFDGNALSAADSLGLSRSAFYRRLEKLKEEECQSINK
ncbi:sigma-54-dependent transcriptional regulator [Aliikangiella coralliicola]|uniref:Sigma-54-dependent Fis family transcriptional regulator n=1 Tax=Aliikangiella coralliicola TaxID=2592383 RepID=A0A545UF81_9GAMM|nr:sigma-54 dependent transcriptional regulator [Aliikangiella coralliicola]TQV88136.1 sigma-54-dependent Fis family transcriptional regulator [Aliikangiella coralliicola]